MSQHDLKPKEIRKEILTSTMQSWVNDFDWGGSRNTDNFLACLNEAVRYLTRYFHEDEFVECVTPLFIEKFPEVRRKDIDEKVQDYAILASHIMDFLKISDFFYR